MAHPELAEAEGAERVFTLFDDAERFACDRASILDT